MEKDNKIIAIIGARGGSKGIIKKNIRPLGGKPLMYYTIAAALGSKYINRVIVSTDDEEIASVAKDCGAETPFLRPPEIAQDNSSVSDMLKHTITWLEENENYVPDIIVYLQVTEPFRKKGIIDVVIKRLIDNKELDSVFVAKPTHKKFWKLDKNNNYIRLREKDYTNRQKSEMWYREDTGTACATRANIVKQGYRVGDKVNIISVDHEYDVDIHDETDLWIAEKIIQKEKEKGDSEYHL